MTSLYKELITRIRSELKDLDLVVSRAMRSWEQVKRATEDQDAFIDSVALNLHSFYSGLERLFELIARHIDGSVPTGESWHRDLLRRMANDLANVRPAVVCQDTADSLDEFRRFRHLVRNVYTTNLLPDKMNGFMSALPKLWLTIRTELYAFADFLEELDRAVG